MTLTNLVWATIWIVCTYTAGVLLGQTQPEHERAEYRYWFTVSYLVVLVLLFSLYWAGWIG